MNRGRHFFLFVCSLVFCAFVYSQEEEPVEVVLRNQISTNFTYLLTASPDLNFERTLGKNFAIGIGGTLYGNIYRELNIPNGNGYRYQLNYEVTPFGRWYINGTQNKSHFIEAFMSINSGEKEGQTIRTTNAEGYGVYVIGTDKLNDVGLGGAYGYRFLFLDNKLVLEASIGLRTNFVDTSGFGFLQPAIARAGIKVGYRF